jgi:hypothetical protein
MTTVALGEGYWSVLGHGVAAITLYAIVGLALIVLGFFVLDWTTPGPLRTLVQARRPNAAAIAASGLVSLSLVVVLAIFASSGELLDGLISTTGIDIGAVLAAERYTPEVLVVVAAHFGLGLIVAASIL